MKRYLRTLFAAALCAVSALGICLAGCAAGPETPQDNGSTTPAPPAPSLPASSEVVSAIQKTADKAEQNYDFVLQLSGNVKAGVVSSPNANAIYTCNYRYDRSTGALRFKRVTSGILLYDSTEYIYSSGSSRITVKMNEDGDVKKVIADYKDTELRLINLPFQSLIESLTADEITNIKKDGNGYSAMLKLSSDNAIVDKICSLIGRMDTSINLKGVKFTNPVSGIQFKFGLSDGEIADCALGLSVSVPVSSASVTLNLSYTMQRNSSAIDLPAVAGLLTGETVGSGLSTINAALASVKNDAAYSLDLNAENEMDPAWNVLGTKDTYQARLYKNTDERGGTHFNHSFEYHSHHEADGKETYKYTYGDVTQDGKTYLVSRKGSNTYEVAEGVTADTQFEFLTEPFALTAQEIDCIRKNTAGNTVTYTVYLSDDAVVSKMKDILNVLNGNTADGVVPVENYFNESDYTVKDAELVVVMTDGKLVSMKLDTEIKYNPTAGEYTENNITLNNVLLLEVNKNLKDAEKYEAPKTAQGTGLGDARVGGLKYIL